MNSSSRRFSLRGLLLATALVAVAVALAAWSRDPGEYMAGASAWELSFLARLFTLPVICGLVGSAAGLLVNRPWIGALAGLAVAGLSAPALFLWWFNS